jgi:ATP-dependent exoDNAse (exonuclease V) beta subunit
MVNRLNSLYVGFTRPEEELYVIGVKEKDTVFPFDLLPEHDFPQCVKPYKEGKSGKKLSEAPVMHHQRKIEFQSRTEEIISTEEKRRGEFIHSILSHLEYLQDGFEKELDRIIVKVGEETGETCSGGMREIIIAFLRHHEVLPYFMKKEGRIILREQEFSDAWGRLFRMDRVVIDPDRVAVIDYKTGQEKAAEEQYRIQLKNYMKILKELYPERDVEGIIAYVDLREIRRIG